jgi:hypothetical protein
MRQAIHLVKRRRNVLLIPGAVAAAILLLSVAVRLRPPSIEEESRSFLQALVSFDADSLLRYSHDHEKRILKLDERKLQLLLDRLVKPRVGRLSPAGPLESETIANGVQAQAWQNYTDSNGRRIEIMVAPVATPTGAKELITTKLLNLAWTEEYIIKRGLPVTSANFLKARLEGLRNDVPMLRQIGIEGGVSPLPNDPQLYTWDSILERAEMLANRG